LCRVSSAAWRGWRRRAFASGDDGVDGNGGDYSPSNSESNNQALACASANQGGDNSDGVNDGQHSAVIQLLNNGRRQLMLQSNAERARSGGAAWWHSGWFAFLSGDMERRRCA
jgi:hypothetical protein